MLLLLRYRVRTTARPPAALRMNDVASPRRPASVGAGVDPAAAHAGLLVVARWRHVWTGPTLLPSVSTGRVSRGTSGALSRVPHAVHPARCEVVSGERAAARRRRTAARAAEPATARAAEPATVRGAERGGGRGQRGGQRGQAAAVAGTTPCQRRRRLRFTWNRDAPGASALPRNDSGRVHLPGLEQIPRAPGTDSRAAALGVAPASPDASALFHVERRQRRLA